MRIASILMAVLLGVLATTAHAASLQVQPALLEVAAPGQATTLTLRNLGGEPINVQLRMFRWTQNNGVEKLEPTDEVVASPPAVTLKPNADYVARVVRTSRAPISGEASYRLLVDQLPSNGPAGANSVKLLVRYSLPVFFSDPQKTAPAITWSIRQRGDRVVVIARNDGMTRLRISDLKVRDASGKTLNFANGLVGYALGRSTMEWTAPSHAPGFAARGPISISGLGNDRQFNATASPER